MAISKVVSKTISKKSNSNNKSSLKANKLNTFEKTFEQHFAALMRLVLQQEKSLNQTVNTLKAKLKKALSQKKSIPAAKKNRTPALDKQLMKAQGDIDNFELHLALAIDELSLITKKLDSLSAIQQHTPKKIASSKAKQIKTQAPAKNKKQPKTTISKVTAAKPKAAPAKKTAAQPAIKSKSKLSIKSSKAKPVAKPVAKAVAKATAKSTTKPINKPAVKATAKAAALAHKKADKKSTKKQMPAQSKKNVTAKKVKGKAGAKTEQFDLSEFFTPNMDFGLASESSNTPANVE